MKNGKMNAAICISGGGSTMSEVGLATKNGILNRINLALVLSSDPNAEGNKRAKAVGVPEKDIVVIPRKGETEASFGEKIHAECKPRAIDTIFMCGFLPKMPKMITEQYAGRIYNQHPGPIDTPNPVELRGFGGKGMHGKAVHHAVIYFAARCGRPFCTFAVVHHATNDIDGGLVVGASPMELVEGHTADSLQNALIPQERKLVIQTLFYLSEYGDDGVQSLLRIEPLILPSERNLLAASIAAGREAFPNG